VSWPRSKRCSGARRLIHMESYDGQVYQFHLYRIFVRYMGGIEFCGWYGVGMDRCGIAYLTQEEFSQLDITALDKILNGIHFHRSRLDGQEVFALQARAVITHGRNRPADPAPRPQPDNNNDRDADGSVDDGCDNNPSEPADDAEAGAGAGAGAGSDSGSGSGAGGGDPGAARSKRELRDAERRAARLADYPEIADALGAGQISTEQADLISRAKVSTRTKLELLAAAKHEHADQTAEAVKAAVREADTESADDRYNRQRGNRRGGCGVNDDGMYWLSLLIDPVTGARIKGAYDPRFRTAWAKEKELDRTTRRVPKQLAGDIIANMLLGLPAIYDFHPQAQTDSHHAADAQHAGDASEPGTVPETWAEPAETERSPEPTVPASANSASSKSRHGHPPTAAPDRHPTRRANDGDRGGNLGVRFVEVGKDADGNETRTDLGTYTPIRPAPLHEPRLIEPPPDVTESEAAELDGSDSDRKCRSCRTSGPPPGVSGPASDRKSDSRSGGSSRANINVVIGLSDLNDLADRQAVGYTPDGVPIPATLVRTFMCDADISYWIEQADSQQLTLARTARYATPIQHQALLVRDGGCVWKHCTMPASACEAHHITFWEHQGKTNLEQMCLLCPAHHRKLHAMGHHLRPGTQPRTWKLTRDSDGQTTKTWTNPPHRQKPGHHAA